MKYVYPAILTQEDDGIIVSFPDVEGARAYGATMEEALETADDVLNLMLLTMEEKHMDTKPPTPIASLDVPKGSTVALVRSDTSHTARKLTQETFARAYLFPRGWTAWHGNTT